MKTKCLLLVFLAVFSAQAFSQVPNAGFEDWSYQNSILRPDGWQTSCEEECPNAVRSEDSYQGSYSLELLVVYDAIMGSNMSGYAFTDGNFPVSERYESFSAYIKGDIIGNDTLKIMVGMWLDGEMIGYGQFQTLQSHSGWTKVTIDITYLNNDTPTEAFVSLQLGPVFGGNIGSRYLLDWLEFSDQPSAAGNLQSGITRIYPNPVSDLLTIETANDRTDGMIRLVNRYGQAVYQSGAIPGSSPMTIDVRELPAGLYLLQEFSGGRIIRCEKVIIRY
ncbi:MAG: T9SS type A sorting domain-containing protein [Alphaproteobacteria bacterium]|nr:T9SS type A sorting domain-containing protein [Alphaproteobacteria bacterium]